VATVAVDPRAEVAPPSRWLLILAGVLWLIVGLVLLSLDATSAATLGYMVGFVLIFAGVDELMTMVVAPGWRWLHGVLGVIFLLGGIAAVFEPFQTFGVLALFIGWYLVFKGAFDMVTAVGFRHELPLWGLTLTVGVLELLLGFWAVGYPGRSAWLLLVWVGVGAMLRGIGDLVAAFTYRRLVV
jgi:uncharacterized membrane protein HdeD (DUF308 family)